MKARKVPRIVHIIHDVEVAREAKPEAVIEIVRSFGGLFDDDGDGGAKAGGVGPNPCLVADSRVTEQEIMKAILHLSREVASIKAVIKPRG